MIVLRDEDWSAGAVGKSNTFESLLVYVLYYI
jgi:hypothetical protein